MKTIDLTPTWVDTVKTYLLLMRDQPKNDVIWNNASAEIIRLAEQQDKRNAEAKAAKAKK